LGDFLAAAATNLLAFLLHYFDFQRIGFNLCRARLAKDFLLLQIGFSNSSTTTGLIRSFLLLFLFFFYSCHLCISFFLSRHRRLL